MKTVKLFHLNNFKLTMIWLPDELVLIIFGYCDIRSILDFCRVYQEYKSLGKVIIIEKYSDDNLTGIREKYKTCYLEGEYCDRMFYNSCMEPPDDALKVRIPSRIWDYREKNFHLFNALIADFKKDYCLKYRKNMVFSGRLICASISKNNKLLYVLSEVNNIQLEIIDRRLKTIKRYIYRSAEKNSYNYYLSRTGIVYHHSENIITIYKKTNIKTIKFSETFNVVTDIQQHKNKLYISCKDTRRMVIYDMEKGTTKTINNAPRMRISDNGTIVTMSPIGKACIVSIYDLYDVELIFQVKLKRFFIDRYTTNHYLTLFCYSKL